MPARWLVIVRCRTQLIDNTDNRMTVNHLHPRLCPLVPLPSKPMGPTAAAAAIAQSVWTLNSFENGWTNYERMIQPFVVALQCLSSLSASWTNQPTNERRRKKFNLNCFRIERRAIMQLKLILPTNSVHVTNVLIFHRDNRKDKKKEEKGRRMQTPEWSKSHYLHRIADGDDTIHSLQPCSPVLLNNK